jgi:MYXO-CTERM domain-containing protein
MPIEFGGSGTTSGTFDFPDSVPLNGQASVAVRAVDRFGNKGSLTSFVCVTRYPVTSWWDMHCSGTSPPPECSSDGCAIAPAGHKSALGFASVAIAALALIVRRRRSPR